ncbi:hypothetical protein CA3LBN_004163 [Candidozyma haemuli]|uniref:CWH43-like N-terminal domain-containing protein n=2 Tax=Candidozyma TaxID=3303203 RepID=A0ABX8IAU5_9ASCO|nr:hypothetical protein CA3LBN_004163 [[Candida] haemuloni]
MSSSSSSPTPKWLRFKKFHYYLIPLVALVVWWGMLIALMSAWSIQGHPMYSFMDGYHKPVYISDIGATNLQPLFISCTGFQLIFFVGTLLMEFVLRKMRKLQPYVSNKQHWFAIVSIVCAMIGQLGILMVSIFNTNAFHPVHITMVAVFIFFIFWACFFNFLNSFIFGNFPSRLHPNHEKVIFGKHRWANLYMVSFFFKLIWLIAAVVFAAFFGFYMKNGEDSKSACFEWTISFWYGLLLIFWAIDLFPSAVKHYRVHHPEEYDTEFVDSHKQETAQVGGHNSFQPIPKRHSFSSGIDDTTLNSPPRAAHLHEPNSVNVNPYDGAITVPVQEPDQEFQDPYKSQVPPQQTYTGDARVHEFSPQQIRQMREDV